MKNELFAFGWKTSIVSPLIFSAQSVDLTIFAVVVRALSLFAFTLALFHTITELMWMLFLHLSFCSSISLFCLFLTIIWNIESMAWHSTLNSYESLGRFFRTCQMPEPKKNDDWTCPLKAEQELTFDNDVGITCYYTSHSRGIRKKELLGYDEQKRITAMT